MDFLFSIQAYHGHFGVLEEVLYKYHSYIDSKDGKGRTHALDLAAYKGYKWGHGGYLCEHVLL